MLTPRRLDDRLGVVRVPLALADEFRALGHEVTLITGSDVGVGRRTGRLLTDAQFALAARRHLRSRPGYYDVVDAGEGTLPYSKLDLRLSGVLAVRSAGLSALFYADKRRDRGWQAPRWRPWERAAGGWDTHQALRRSRLSLEHADRVFVLNTTERDHARRSAPNSSVVVLPNGTSATERGALRSARLTAAERHERRCVGFIGRWIARKGCRDWNTIVAELLRLVPDAHFKFLGTWADYRTVLADLPGISPRRIEVVPNFGRRELPYLLSDVTVGALPSYVEGFPLASLEFAAAGIPPVSYASPGTDEVGRRICSSLTAPRGSPRLLAERLSDVLRLPCASYAALCDRALAVSGAYDWQQIAAATLAAYEPIGSGRRFQACS